MFSSPFLYLFACSLKNRVRGRLKRLREPKYAIGAIVGAAYFYMVLFRRVRIQSRGAPASVPEELPEASTVLAALQLAAAFGLWVVVLARWIVPVSRQPLQFSAPERDFLLTAPLARRRIVRYKLLRSLLGIFLGTVIMLLFARSALGNTWSFLVGTFLLFTTVRLHLLGIALTRRTLLQGAGRRDPAAVVALAVVVAGSVAVALTLLPALAHLQHTGDIVGASDLVRRVSDRPAVAIGLLPFSVMVRPVFAQWPGPFAAAALPVVVIAFVNYRWVLRSEGRFERTEETTEHEVAEGRRAPVRPVTRRAPFALAMRGAPESALIWKNLILLGRYAAPRTVLRVAAPLVAVAVIAGTGHRSEAVTAFVPVTIALCCGLTVLGPYSVRNDLRQDLLRLSVLKTWPISGERLLWGEVLAPAIVTSALVWLLVLVTGALSLAIPAAELPWSDRVAIGISAGILFPALILAQVAVQNTAVVLFPGWVVTGPSRPRGVEAMGQQMLMLAGTMLLLAVGVLPGALLGGLVLLVGYQLVGWLALVPASLIVTALLVAEIVLGLHFLGAAVERMEPTSVEAPL